MIDTYAKGQALADAVRIADRPGAPGAGTPPPAGPACRPARTTSPRSCTGCGRAPPARRTGCGWTDTLASLRGLRSAMADEQAAGGAGGPGSPEAAQVHGRLMSFEESLRALRAPYEQMPRI